MLSYLSRPSDRITAFALGADDVITTPFDNAELVARVRAVIRRNKNFSQPSLHAGPRMLRLDSRENFVNGRPVHLTAKEFAVLELLMQRKGTVLSKDFLLNSLYCEMDEAVPKIIDVFISKIRKKLAEAGADGMIGTVWGKGYMLCEPSRKIRAMAQQADEGQL